MSPPLTAAWSTPRRHGTRRPLATAALLGGALGPPMAAASGHGGAAARSRRSAGPRPGLGVRRLRAAP